MSVQIVRTIINTWVSAGDGDWGRGWRQVSQELQIYALGYLKITYISLTVMMGILIPDFFLDLDILLSTSNSV